jgi:Replication initiator protein, pSAM2
VAAYVAKYATKSTEQLGAALNRRITDAVELDALPVRPHVARLVRTAWELGGNPRLKRLRLRRWAHQLGFGGHWSTKSRRYSTTFTALRRARIAHTLARRHGPQPLDLWGRAASEEASVALASWAYRGRGYRIPQGARLAVSSAVRARARSA